MPLSPRRTTREEKEAYPPSKVIKFVKEGEVAKDKQTNTIVSGDATRGNATHNDFVGKYNPSYVLMKSKDGILFAKYVGTSYGNDYHWTIWVPAKCWRSWRGLIFLCDFSAFPSNGA